VKLFEGKFNHKWQNKILIRVFNFPPDRGSTYNEPLFFKVPLVGEVTRTNLALIPLFSDFQDNI